MKCKQGGFMITYTKNDVAKMFKISRTTLYRHMEKNNIDKNSKLTDKEISILKQSIRPTLTLEADNIIKNEEHQQIIDQLKKDHLNEIKVKDEQIIKLEAIIESLTKQNEAKIVEQFTEKLNHFEKLLIKMEDTPIDMIEELGFEDDAISETEVNEELNEMIKQIQTSVDSEIAIEELVDEVEPIDTEALKTEIKVEAEEKQFVEEQNEELIEELSETTLDEIVEEDIKSKVELEAETIEELPEEILNEEVMKCEEDIDILEEAQNSNEIEDNTPIKKKKRWWKR